MDSVRDRIVPTHRPARTRAPLHRRHRAVAAWLVGAGALPLVAALAATPASAPQNSAPTPPTAPKAPSAPAVETFRIDPAHSVALFRVAHMGAGVFWGRFDSVTGSITFDGAQELSFEVAIDVNSVSTASSQRDNHLKSPDFFSAKEFPTMSFKSTGSKKTSEHTFDVTGNLTIRGVTKPITAKVEWTGTADMGMGRRAGFEATFTIARGDFGVNYGLDKGALGKDVKVTVALEGIGGR